MAQRLRKVLHAGLSHETHLTFNHEATQEHGQKTDERDEEVNLQRGDRDDQTSTDAKNCPSHGAYRMSVQTRRRDCLRKAFIGF